MDHNLHVLTPTYATGNLVFSALVRAHKRQRQAKKKNEEMAAVKD